MVVIKIEDERIKVPKMYHNIVIHKIAHFCADLDYSCLYSIVKLLSSIDELGYETLMKGRYGDNWKMVDEELKKQNKHFIKIREVKRLIKDNPKSKKYVMKFLKELDKQIIPLNTELVTIFGLVLNSTDLVNQGVSAEMVRLAGRGELEVDKVGELASEYYE